MSLNPRFKILDAPIIFGMMLVSCTEPQLDQKDVIKIPTSELSEDSLQSAFLATLNEIDHNLELIRQKEGMIAMNPVEGKQSLSMRERILRNIQMINSLLDQNQRKIAELDGLLKQSTEKNTVLSKLKKDRSASVSEQNKRIDQLKSELSRNAFKMAELNQKLSELEMEREKLEQMVVKLDTQINRAYYALGTFRELRENGVVEKEGGLLGIGRTKSLATDLNTEYFTELDIRETENIAIFSRKADLISNHPESSYEFETEGKQIQYLHILDPDEFWQTSKYLVVELHM